MMRSLLTPALLLLGTLAGCGEVILRTDAGPCTDAACPDGGGAGNDGDPATPGRQMPGNQGDSPDGATDALRDTAPGDRAGALAADLASQPDLPPVPGPDAAGDLAPMVSPDAAPDMAVIVPPDAAPDTAPSPPDVPVVVVPPDAAPDLAPDIAPDLAPDLAPDVAPDVTPPASCPSGRGPAMIKADLAAQPYCIDSTEVTNAQYADFLATTGNGSQTGGQQSACSWNSSYLPSTAGSPWPYAAGRGNRPVVNIDWCDAQAFCKWAGKRLCGKIGGGSITGWASGADTGTSQWASACNRNGQRSYPYGATYSASACNTDAPAEDIQHLADVGSHAQCQGGYTGLWDMSGNVEEWLDACDSSTGASNLCASAGNSAWLDGLPPGDVTCTESVYETPRNSQYELLGFRCCADL